MIYVITERPNDNAAKHRNEHIEGHAAFAVSTRKYGNLVKSAHDVRQAVHNGDKTLYVFAHGNEQQFGPFNAALAVLQHLQDKLGILTKDGTFVHRLVLNACNSEKLAQNLRHLVMRKLPPYTNLTIVGTTGRAFTDLAGDIRVAKDDDGANILDAAVKDGKGASRYSTLLDTHCKDALGSVRSVKIGSG